MKLKLGNSIALSMVAMLFLSIMAIFPASSVATPKIYMDPAVNEVGKDHLEGAGIGFKWNITLWVIGYGTPPVFAWQVGLLYDLVAGINCTRAWVANFDPAYIFVDAGPGVTYPTTEVVTPSPQDILIWNTTVVDLENPVSDAWRWTDGTNKYNVHDYTSNRSGKFGPCAFLRLGNETSGDTTWCHIESVAGNLQVVVKQAGFAKVGDTLTTQPAQGPPPDPAKLAIFEFEIIYAPPSGKVFSNLDIDNEDTYLLNYDLDEVPTAKEKGYYEYKYAPIADFTIAPDFPTAEQSVTFNASSSYDLDGNIVSYAWDFGDGNITTVTSPVIIHQYVAAGNYTIKLTATDNDDLTNTKTSVVRVRDYPTAAFVYSPSVPDVGSSVTFDASSSVPNGGVILYYLWDFGDGSSLTNTTNTVTTHVFNAFGNYTITLTVTDNEGLSNSDAKTVIVEAQPEGILLYAAIITVLAAIVIAAAIVTYYKRIRKYKSRTV